MAAAKRQLKTLKFEDKISILLEVDRGVLLKKDIAEKYSIPRSTLSTIIKNKSAILKFAEASVQNQSFKRIAKLTYKNVDTTVLNWIALAHHNNLPVTGPIIKKKAIGFAQSLGHKNFKASSGWLDKFKRRYGITPKVQARKPRAPEESCEDLEQNLPAILKGFSAENVFNVAAIGLFFKCLPDKALSLKNENCNDGKLSKERVTCMIAANMSGTEKLKLVLVGDSPRSQCFKDIHSLPVNFYNNKKAWMTTDIFEKWILNEDKKFTEEGREVLLFVDKCPSHPKSLQQKLKSIKLEFVPPSVTSIFQPIKHGVSYNLKYHYRRRILDKMLAALDENKPIPEITLLDCVTNMSMAWNIDVSPSTIRNSFEKSGFGRSEYWQEDNGLSAPNNRSDHGSVNLEGLQPQFEFWLRRHWLNLDSVTLDDYINIDNDLTTEQPADVHILKGSSMKIELCESDKDDNVEDEIQFEKPTNSKLDDAFKTIRNFLLSEKDTPDGYFRKIDEIEDFYEHRKRKDEKPRNFLLSEKDTPDGYFRKIDEIENFYEHRKRKDEKPIVPN